MSWIGLSSKHTTASSGGLRFADTKVQHLWHGLLAVPSARRRLPERRPAPASGRTQRPLSQNHRSRHHHLSAPSPTPPRHDRAPAAQPSTSHHRPRLTHRSPLHSNPQSPSVPRIRRGHAAPRRPNRPSQPRPRRIQQCLARYNLAAKFYAFSCKISTRAEVGRPDSAARMYQRSAWSVQDCQRPAVASKLWWQATQQVPAAGEFGHLI